MSEVKRYGMSGFGGGLIEIDGGPFVDADDFDAQRLRADTAEAERDAWKDMREQSRARNAKLRKKLAAAEQRNADLLALLRDTKTMLASELSYELYHNIAVHMKRIDAALNPNPEAESQ